MEESLNHFILLDGYSKSNLCIGNARFDLILGKNFFQPSQKEPRFHCHIGYKLECIEKGEYCFHFETEDLLVRGPALLLIPPMVYHNCRPVSQGGIRYFFEFSLSACGGGKNHEAYSLLLMQNSRPSIWQTEFPSLTAYQSELSAADEEQRYLRTSTIGAILICLFSAMRKQLPISEARQPEPPRSNVDKSILLGCILRYIEENAAVSLSLQDVSAAFHISSRQIERLLKAGLQKSFKVILNNYRVRLSVQRIVQGNMNLTEIASSVGFPNYSTFWKHFTAYCGMSPSAFLRQYSLLG